METKNTALKGGMLKCVIFLFCYIVFIKILPYFLHNPNYQCAMYIVMGIAGLLISLPELKEAGASWKAHPVRNVLLIIGGFIVMNIIDNLAIIPYALLYSEQAGSINDSNLEVARQLAEPVLLVLGAGILGPIVEETVFRSILMRKQGDFIPKAVVVFVSSVLFGMIHLHAFTVPEMLSILPHICFGIAMAILYLKTKNITLVYALHILNNLPAVLMMFTH